MLILHLALLAILASNSQAYHNGGDDTNCWLGPNYRELVDPCDIAKVHFISKPSDDDDDDNNTTELFTNHKFSVIARLDVNPLHSLLKTNGEYLVPHANIHMCKAEMGWCTPDVRVQPGLSTQSPEIKSDSLLLVVDELIVPESGDWTVVAHFRFTTITNEEWDVAAGFKQRFKQELIQENAEHWAILLCQCLASVGMVFSVLATAVVVVKRDHWVFKSSTPSMSVLMSIGCLIAFGAVFTLPTPENYLVCNVRVWLLSLAFDFVLVPFGLRTWRVYKLFDRSTGFRRKAITDALLIKLGAVLVVLDIGFCLMWTLAWPLTISKVPFVSNPEVVYSLQCTGSNQLVLEIMSFLFHGLPLIWLAYVGRKVRKSFQQRALLQTSTAEDSAKMAFFNESEAISQTLLSLGCVSMFAIALQYTVRDSPTSVLLMVSGGVLWSAYFTLAVNFLPRAIHVLFYENDGVTKRETNGSKSQVLTE